MPRASRIVQPEIPHHVTQRGVNRQDVFFSNTDREVYLSLIEENRKDAGVSIVAYCLLTNHVHWLVVPERPDSLAILFRRVHGRYAQYVNPRLKRTGHLWQNRYFSCPVEKAAVGMVARYIELNPCRARMVMEPGAYRWSSAPAHLAGPTEACAGVELDGEVWREWGGRAGWRSLLEAGSGLEEVLELRRCTYAGKPFGSPDFLAEMESRTGRKWRHAEPGRKAPAKEKGTERSGPKQHSATGGRAG